MKCFVRIIIFKTLDDHDVIIVMMLILENIQGGSVGVSHHKVVVAIIESEWKIIQALFALARP